MTEEKQPTPRAKTIAAIRWTVEKASAEFDINPRTLSKRLRRESIEPGEDGKFSTQQICSAIYGDLETEQLLKIREEREILQIKKGQLLKGLIPAEFVTRVVDSMVITLRQKVLHLEKLTEEEKAEMLTDLQSIPIDEYFTDPETGVEDDSEEESITP